ncbi:uncharacterized protein LOC134261040 [Saccostrea cucullata]|uniref:uncharacterized protein LOC134261040 n=1 Tax=Saccostrea cuccullata TaxID=36930 RepID=UPI002ED55CB4
MPRLSENQRNIAVGMLQAGMAQNIVAGHFGVHRNTIQSLWRRFHQSGNTRDRPRSERPRVTSRRQDNHIRLVHLRNRFQTASLTARSIPGLRPISPRTVRNRLRERNIRPRRPAVRPILLQCHHFIWTAVTAVVECIVALGSGSRTLVLCNNDNSVEVALWCGVESQHVERTPLQIVNGNLTGVHYTDEIIQQHVIPFIQRQQNHITLQQDNARPHVACVVRDVFVQQNVDVLPWPAVSPDLLPIEHVWDEMERRLSRLPNQPMTLADLGQALTNIWNNIPQAYLNTLVASMRRRYQACVNANSGHTRY